MTRDLAFPVYGLPRPMGSKKGFVNPRNHRVVVIDDEKGLVRDWKAAVKAGALEAMHRQLAGELANYDPGAATDAQVADWVPMTGPISVLMIFHMPRPKGHYGTGRNAGVLKASAPGWPIGTPDLDKLQRSTYDALTEVRAWKDDAQVVMADVMKTYCAINQAPGAFVRITDISTLEDTVGRALEDVKTKEGLL